MNSINGSFLNFLKSKGLINGKKQIISEGRHLTNKLNKISVKVKTPSATTIIKKVKEKPIIPNLNPANICNGCGLIDCECDEYIGTNGPISFADGFDEEIKNWGNWADEKMQIIF